MSLNRLICRIAKACRISALAIGMLTGPGCARSQQHAISTQMTALREAIRAEKPAALADFITGVKARGGTPLIQAIPGDEQNVHVTFLWQGSASTRGVLIDWYPFTISRTAELSMIQMENTQLWYRTLRVPRGSRFLYQLSVNDPRTTIPNGTGRARPGPDPLNPGAISPSCLKLPRSPTWHAAKALLVENETGVHRFAYLERTSSAAGLHAAGLEPACSNSVAHSV